MGGATGGQVGGCLLYRHICGKGEGSAAQMRIRQTKIVFSVSVWSHNTALRSTVQQGSRPNFLSYSKTRKLYLVVSHLLEGKYSRIPQPNMPCGWRKKLFSNFDPGKTFYAWPICLPCKPLWYPWPIRSLRNNYVREAVGKKFLLAENWKRGYLRSTRKIATFVYCKFRASALY